MKYELLSQHRQVFQSLTGLRVKEFDDLFDEVEPQYEAAEYKRLNRANRQRAIGAGHPYELSVRDQALLCVIWLRTYPTYEVLGYLFGISDTSVGRVIQRVLPLLEQAGRDQMRMPDPGKKRRRQLDDLLKETPGLMVLVDSFEQRVQRPPQRQEADGYYSGKKKQHTLKSQVVVDEHTGEVVDISVSVPGPTADIALLKLSTVIDRLPDGVGIGGDLAYIGMDKLYPDTPSATPRRKPRGKERPPDDVAFNTAFARRRIPVENTIGRLRRYQSLTQTDRHHRLFHAPRVVAVAGLVNRQIRHRLPC